MEASGRVWHDLRFVHVPLANHGLTRRWKWYREDLEKAWRTTKVDGTNFHLGVAPATRISNICTSFALVMALWVDAGSLRAARVARAWNILRTAMDFFLRVEVVKNFGKEAELFLFFFDEVAVAAPLTGASTPGPGG